MLTKQYGLERLPNSVKFILFLRTVPFRYLFEYLIKSKTCLFIAFLYFHVNSAYFSLLLVAP